MEIERDVTQILSAATDSVDLINGVNDGSWNVEGMEQSEINDMVQRNVDHLEIILAYEEVVADSSDKSSYTDAISTGKAFIAAH
jgi:hypothetical protein